MSGDGPQAAESQARVVPEDKPVPGVHNFVGDMDPSSLLVTAQRCLIQAPLTDTVRAPAGGASVGMLATLMDVGASDPALAACQHDWTATQDLAIHGGAPATEGPIVVDCRLVRVGKKVVVVSTDAYDGHGIEDFDELVKAIDSDPEDRHGRVTLAASGLVTFARIPRAAASGVDDYNPARWVGQIRHRANPDPGTGTMYERMAFVTVDPAAGQVELHRTPYVANSIGTINGGAQALLLEVAAEAMRPGMVATDMQIHYLSQVKAGPARTSGAVIRDATDHSVVDLQLVDAGHDDQLLALATVTLQRFQA